jgi:RNA-binding protein YlmH
LNWTEKIKLFNTPSIQAINQKIAMLQKIKEQQEQIRIREAIAEAQRRKIDQWWEQEKKKIVPWTENQRADYQKLTFYPDEKTNESWIRSKTNEWKKLENR